MPKEGCTKGGIRGIRWGNSGTCYTGPDKEKRMQAQQRAIEASKNDTRKRRP